MHIINLSSTVFKILTEEKRTMNLYPLMSSLALGLVRKPSSTTSYHRCCSIQGVSNYSSKNNYNNKNQGGEKLLHHQTTTEEEPPFSLILPRSSIIHGGNNNNKMEENKRSSDHVVLGKGLILLKNYIPLPDQVEIVNICQKFGMGRGGFYQPGYSSVAKLRLHMMCFGRNWDPRTKYDVAYRSDDGSEAPPLPHKFISLVQTALEDSQAILDEIPSMYPDICIANFYTTTGRLGLHQDRDESPDSIRRGLPVVSISIGDSAEFLYGNTRDVRDAHKVLLKSGDVFIFGGKSRRVFHGVNTIIPDSAPLPLLQQTMLRPGRLNLTFRQF